MQLTGQGSEDGRGLRRNILDLFVMFGIFIAGLLIAIVKCDGWWLASSGALIVVVGVLLEYWPVLTTRRADDLAFWMSQSSHEAMQLAIYFVIVGTLVWAFGQQLFEIWHGS